MRITLLTLLAVCGFGMLGPASAQIATQYPVWIQSIDNPGWSGCSFDAINVAADPMYDKLRCHPRYQALVASMNLQHVSACLSSETRLSR